MRLSTSPQTLHRTITLSFFVKLSTRFHVSIGSASGFVLIEVLTFPLPPTK